MTGGSGFVGANLVRRLVDDGHAVTLLLRSGHETWRLDDVASDVEQCVTGLDDFTSVRQLVTRVRPEWIFHLAAHGAYSWQTDIDQIVRTNVLGTVNLIDACARVGFDRLIHTGSSSEYGFTDHAPAESEWVDPNSAYAWSKASATQFCRYVARHRHLNVVTLRLYSVYGPFEEPRRLIPSLIVRALDGRLPPLVAPDTVRDFVYADDVCDAILRAATMPLPPGEVLNIGSGQQTTVEHVVDTVRRLLHVAEAPSWSSMPQRAWDAAVWVSDPRRAATLLDWRCTTSLEAGIDRTIRWFTAHPHVIDRYRAHLDRE